MKSTNYSVKGAFSAAFTATARRQLPGALIAAAVAAIVSVIYALFYCTGYYGYDNDISYGVKMWGSAVLFIAAVYSAISVGVMFNAYFSRRACDYHFAMPFKRSHLYHANFLFGLTAIALLIAVSVAVFSATVGILSVSNPDGDVTYMIQTAEVLKPLLTLLASLLAGYSACTMCAVVSGKWLQYALLVFVCIFSVPVLLIGIASRINSIWGIMVSLFDFASITPVGAAAMLLKEPADGVCVFMSVVALVECLGMYLAGLLSFKRRKAEIAESGQGGSFIKYLLMALFVASGFLYFGASENLLVTIVTGVITAFVCAALFSAVQVRRKKIFTKQTGILFGAVTGICLVLTVGIYFSNSSSYVKYVPEVDEVESVTITEYDGYDSYSSVSLDYIMQILNGSTAETRRATLTEPQNIQTVVDFHTLAVSDKVIRNTSANGAENANDLLPAGSENDVLQETTAAVSDPSAADGVTVNEEDYFIGDRIDCSLAYKLKNGRTVYRSYAIKSPDYDLWHQFLAAFKNKEAVMQEEVFAVDINDVLYVETTVYQIVTGEEETSVADQSYVLPAAEWEQIRDVLAEDRTKEEDDVFYYGSATGATLTVYCINPELPEEQKAQLRAMTPKEKYDYVSLAGSNMLSDPKKFPVYPEVGYSVYITVQDENAMHLLQSPETRDSAILTLDLT